MYASVISRGFIFAADDWEEVGQRRNASNTVPKHSKRLRLSRKRLLLTYKSAFSLLNLSPRPLSHQPPIDTDILASHKRRLVASQE